MFLNLGCIFKIYVYIIINVWLKKFLMFVIKYFIMVCYFLSLFYFIVSFVLKVDDKKNIDQFVLDMKYEIYLLILEYVFSLKIYFNELFFEFLFGLRDWSKI